MWTFHLCCGVLLRINLRQFCVTILLTLSVDSFWLSVSSLVHNSYFSWEVFGIVWFVLGVSQPHGLPTLRFTYMFFSYFNNSWIHWSHARPVSLLRSLVCHFHLVQLLIEFWNLHWPLIYFNWFICSWY